MNTSSSKYYNLEELTNLDSFTPKTLLYEELKPEDDVINIRHNKLEFLSEFLPSATVSYNNDTSDTIANCLYINIQLNNIFIGFIEKGKIDQFLENYKHYDFKEIETYTEVQNKKLFIREYFNPTRIKKLKSRHKDTNEQ